MDTLRGKIDQMLCQETLAESILSDLLEMEITEENCIAFFDALYVIEIYENDLRQKRMKLNLRIPSTRLLKYSNKKTEEKRIYV